MAANNTTLLDPNAWNVEAIGGNESDDEENVGIKLAVPNTVGPRFCMHPRSVRMMPFSSDDPFTTDYTTLL